jgi:hypothetical protein
LVSFIDIHCTRMSSHHGFRQTYNQSISHQSKLSGECSGCIKRPGLGQGGTPSGSPSLSCFDSWSV